MACLPLMAFHLQQARPKYIYHSQTHRVKIRPRDDNLRLIFIRLVKNQKFILNHPEHTHDLLILIWPSLKTVNHGTCRLQRWSHINQIFLTVVPCYCSALQSQSQGRQDLLQRAAGDYSVFTCLQVWVLQKREVLQVLQVLQPHHRWNGNSVLTITWWYWWWQWWWPYLSGRHLVLSMTKLLVLMKMSCSKDCFTPSRSLWTPWAWARVSVRVSILSSICPTW